MPEKPNEKQAIRNLQTYLRQLSYDDPTMRRPPVDGVFESDTLAALNDFQRMQGLPIRESADEETWALLYKMYLASIAANSAPETIVIFPRVPRDAALDVGAIGFPVAAVQYMLRELSTLYSKILPPDATGVYNNETALAVKEFQQKNNLSPTGRVDLQTWNAIASQHNTLAERYSDE